MPPKAHMKFGDDSQEQSAPATTAKNEIAKTESKSKSLLTSAEAAGRGNGLKRAQDGTPKDTNTNDNDNDNVTNTSNEKGKPSNDSGRAQKSPKLNGGQSEKWDTKLERKEKTPGHDDNDRAKKTQKLNKSTSKKGRPEQEFKSNASVTSRAQYYGPSKQELLARAEELQKSRELLPIWHFKADIRWKLRLHNLLVLNGETGSGKSTQVPQYLYTEKWCRAKMVEVENEDGTKGEAAVGGLIGITQPRRIAALSLARRVATEMGSALHPGAREEGKVGYAVRFDSVQPSGMKIKYLTEGMLLQEMLGDRNLRKYSCIVIDEIHERSMDVDLVVGFLKRIVESDLKGRGGVPLKIVVMSATLDLGGIEAFLAKPGSFPGYKPGQTHLKVIAPHLLENPTFMEIADKAREMTKAYQKRLEEELKPKAIESPGIFSNSRRSSLDSQRSYSSWGGISDSDEEPKPDSKAESKAKGQKSVTATSQEPAKIDGYFVEDMPKTGIPEGDLSKNGVAVQYIRGRQYHVKNLFDEKDNDDYVREMLECIIQVHCYDKWPGDILCFLTGQEDVEVLHAYLDQQETILKRRTGKTQLPAWKVVDLYGSMTPDAQQAAFERPTEKFTRKIILATNIAETSVTLPGVRYVIDSGKAKVKQYRPHLGMESLLVQDISRTSAIQRSGRAGREAEGKCHRLYSTVKYNTFAADDTPEILRCNVIEAVLKMKARGVDDVLSFPLMDSPDPVYMEKALVHLHSMDALDYDSKLTQIGRLMAQFPLPAAHARVLIGAADKDKNCLLEVIDILACLNTDSEIFKHPRNSDQNVQITECRKDLIRREGDLITLLTTMQHFQSENADRKGWCEKRFVNPRAMKSALQIRKQLHTSCVRLKLLSEMPPPTPQAFEPTTPEKAEVIIRTFLKGFVSKTAIMSPDKKYRTSAGNEEISIHPSSVLFHTNAEAILFLDHVFTSKSFARKVSAVQADWIMEAHVY